MVRVEVTGPGGPATGTVTVSAAGHQVSAAVVAGVAMAPLPVTAAGTSEVRVQYSGDASFTAGVLVEDGLTVVAGPAASLTLVQAAPGPVVAGETIRLVATAADGFGNDLGDVTDQCSFASSRPAVDVFDSGVPGEVVIGDAGVRILTAAFGAVEPATLRVVATSDAPQPLVAASIPVADPSFGQTVTASPGVWSPAATEVAYQWLRDGTTPIPGATSARYTPGLQDIGHTLAVRVTARATGYIGTGNVTSAPTAPVTKAPVTVTASVGDAAIQAGQSATVTVAVSVPAGLGQAGGEVRVTAGGVTATGQLSAGQAVVTLTGLPAGNHTVTATWAGTDRFAAGQVTGAVIAVAPPETPADTGTGTGIVTPNQATEKGAAFIALDVPKGKVSTRTQASIGVVVSASSGVVPTGTVTITAGGKSATGVLANGTVSVRLPVLAPGSYTVDARYDGNDALTGATASAGTLKVTKLPAAVTVVLAKATVTTSQRATVKIKVRAVGAGKVGGTVTVSAGGKKAKATVKNGKATVKLPKLRAGNYTVKVVYSGTSLIDKRTRNGVTLRVTR
jgi:hypothetical protein